MLVFHRRCLHPSRRVSGVVVGHVVEIVVVVVVVFVGVHRLVFCVQCLGLV